jgi:LysR family transcriptional regulator, glycine cleavage system transcriptional activator
MSKPHHLLPSLDFLRGFEAAARHLSFTAAAAELFLTQSAVSRQIKGLEEQVGVQLFVRRNRGLTLTEAGVALQRTASAALAQLADTMERIKATEPESTLNVTASVALSALWLVPHLPRFRRLRPDIDVRLSATSDLLDLERERIDVAVRYCAPDRAPPGAIQLFAGDVVPVCAARVARDRVRPLRKPGDLAQHVLLHYDDLTHPAPWMAWSTWLEAAGVADLKPAGAVHFSHLDHAIQAAIAGEGVALGIRSVLQDRFVAGDLVMPFAKTFPANRAYFIVLARRAEHKQHARQFVAWLVSEAASVREAVKRGPLKGAQLGSSRYGANQGS